jgi:hypothetical protein
MSNNAIADIDALMNASMDDIDDLPPSGIPPTGHYNLSVTAERIDPSDSDRNKGKNPYIRFIYEVEAVNEIKNPEEESEAAVGMKFSEIFSPIKKDGTVNEFGMGFLKERCAPFAAHFGVMQMGEIIAAVNKVSVAAELVRVKDKKDEERFNFRLKNVTVL